LNQAEYSSRIDPILASPNGEKEHLHNQLIAAIYGNVTREMPDQGLAPWVSANDKPATGVTAKPTTGDANERRLKGEVMQLLSRDRRRIKDLVNNDVGRAYDSETQSCSRWLTKQFPISSMHMRVYLGSFQKHTDGLPRLSMYHKVPPASTI